MIRKNTISKVYAERLEEKIITLLSKKLGCEPEIAMDIFYRSKLAEQISEGKYGIQYLEPCVLVDDLINNEPSLIPSASENN